MVLSKLLSRSKLSPQGVASIDLEAVDRRLDVDTRRFPAVAMRLVNQLRRAGTNVNVAGYRERKVVSDRPVEVQAQPDVRGGFYQIELRRLPPMDREEEFRMARRHEFMKLRVQKELEVAGIKASLATELAKLPRSELLRRLGGDVHRSDYCDRCLLQLEELRNLYVEGCLHIVLGTVSRYRGLGVDTPDLIQEGNASLFQAIEGFDWRRDVRFRTYAQYWVQQAVLKMLYNSARTVRVPIWVQKLLGKIRRVQDEGRRAGREYTNAEIGQRLGIAEDRVAWVLATKRFAVSLDAEFGVDGGTSLAQLLPDESVVPIPDSVPEGDLKASLTQVMNELPDRERMILSRRFGLGGSEAETLSDIAEDLGITAERVRQLQSAALTRLQKPARLRQLRSFVEQA